MPLPLLALAPAALTAIGEAIFALMARLGLARFLAMPAFKAFLLGIVASIGSALVEALYDFWESSGVRDVLASWVLEKAGINIDPDSITDKEAWKVAIGERAAELINDKLGTTFTTVYPPEEFKAQIKAQVQQDILNRGGKIVDTPTVQAILLQLRQAADLAVGLSGTAIVPILGTAPFSDKIRKQRNNTRARQRAYRQAHPRLQVWVTPDLAVITAAYKAQVSAIIAARP